MGQRQRPRPWVHRSRKGHVQGHPRHVRAHEGHPIREERPMPSEECLFRFVKHCVSWLPSMNAHAKFGIKFFMTARRARSMFEDVHPYHLAPLQPSQIIVREVLRLLVGNNNQQTKSKNIKKHRNTPNFTNKK